MIGRTSGGCGYTGPADLGAGRTLNTHGLVAVSQMSAHPPGQAERYRGWRQERSSSWVPPRWWVGLAMLEVILLAGLAFAVAARRRRRDLALVAAASGGPASCAGSCSPTGCSWGRWRPSPAWRWGSPLPRPAARCPSACPASAPAPSGVFPRRRRPRPRSLWSPGRWPRWSPAWIAARQDVVAALAGRRGITRSRRRWVVLGAVLTAAERSWRPLAPERQRDRHRGWAGRGRGACKARPPLVGLVARMGCLLRWALDGCATLPATARPGPGDLGGDGAVAAASRSAWC